MPIIKLEHYLVLSDDIEVTREFYISVIGLKDGFRADLGFAGYWLYLDDTPVVHIADWESYSKHSAKEGIPVTSKSHSTGAFDHIAFNGTNAQEMIQRLREMGINFIQNDVPKAGLIQLFLSDPNDVKIELNYM